MRAGLHLAVALVVLLPAGAVLVVLAVIAAALVFAWGATAAEIFWPTP